MRPQGERAVEQSGSAYVDLRERSVDLCRRDLAPHRRRVSGSASGLRGSKGTAGINPLHVWKELNGMPHDVSPTGSFSRENSFSASFRAQWAHFLAADRRRGRSRPTLTEHITLLKVLEAIYKSAADGKDVTL